MVAQTADLSLISNVVATSNLVLLVCAVPQLLDQSDHPIDHSIDAPRHYLLLTR